MWHKIKAEWHKWATLTPNNGLYDRVLIWLFFGLLVIGFVMVTSASIPVSTRLYNDPFYFAKRDAVYMLVAIGAFAFFASVSIEKWEKWSAWLLCIAFVLLCALFVVGKSVNGATRWIALGGVNFQPTELAKLAMILYFASFYVRRFNEMLTHSLSFWRPVVVLGIFTVVILQQPDLGSIVVLFIITFSMLFIMGAKLLQFVVLGSAGIGFFILAVKASDYRLKRVTQFMDPFADAYGDGFQLSNSLMAFGQGEFWGRGLGNSVQKLEYLPEAHTDFVMAVIGEEFGLFGISIMILLLLALTWRGLKISRESLTTGQGFKGFFAFGASIWIFFQGFVNLGVASGLLPTKGLTFPLVSYGGSSLIIMAITMSILVRIDHENRLDRVGQAVLKED